LERKPRGFPGNARQTVVILVAIFSQVEAWTITDESVDRLRASLPHADVIHARTDDEMRAGIVDADAAFSWRITGDALGHATRLRWIQSPAAGLGMLLSDRLRRSDILLTNSRGINAQPVAEHAIALAFALARRIHTAVARQGSATWAQNELTEPAPRVLRGATMGVIGLGAIGAEVSRIANGIGMRVLGLRRRPGLPPPAGVDEVLGPREFGRLLHESDVVVIAAPETRETTGLLGARELASMKPGALLVNVGRGALVDESALADALTHGTLGGAALDVFTDEPLPASSPLWSRPNVLVTPHVAGIRADYWPVAVDMFVDNVRRFEAGQPLANLVDKDAGY